MSKKNKKPVDVMANVAKMLGEYDSIAKSHREWLLWYVAWNEEVLESMNRAIGVNETFQSLMDLQDAAYLKLVNEHEAEIDAHRRTKVTLCGLITCAVIIIAGLVSLGGTP